jgi:hypothetical protein
LRLHSCGKSVAASRLDSCSRHCGGCGADLTILGEILEMFGAAACWVDLKCDRGSSMWPNVILPCRI